MSSHHHRNAERDHLADELAALQQLKALWRDLDKFERQLREARECQAASFSDCAGVSSVTPSPDDP